MLSNSLFSGTFERSSTPEVLVAIAALAILSSAFLCPPKHGWTSSSSMAHFCKEIGITTSIAGLIHG